MSIIDTIQHVSAKASHYDKEAPHYDKFNENSSIKVNQIIKKILQKNHVKTVLDLACGTGSQVFYLTNHGYEVTGIDINSCMLEIARQKALKQHLELKFALGDMRTTKIGQFDSVVTIFNAIGHLTKEDFEKTIGNVHANLKSGGLYIFDIFNLDYLLYGDNITKLTIDWQKKTNNITVREIQYSTISKDGILASYDIYHEQKGDNQPTVSNAFQTLQVYSAQQLTTILT